MNKKLIQYWIYIRLYKGHFNDNTGGYLLDRDFPYKSMEEYYLAIKETEPGETRITNFIYKYKTSKIKI